MKSETVQPIAVIGMACRYPGAANLLELWENILTRRQQFRDMPDVRLPAADYYDANHGVPDKTYGCRAAVLDGFDFDPRQYRIPKSTFENTDIVHWLALATALEAFAHAGLQGDAIPRERTGVILGNSLTGEETRSNTLRLRWPFVRRVFRRAADAHGLTAENTQAFEATMEQLYKSVFPPMTEDSLAGGLSNTIAGRICNYLDLHGGGYIVDGACSSSLLSIATAADYLNNHKLDLAVAGGVDVSLDTFELIGFAKATALSKDDMRVYDKRGNGFIPGEGCGMVLLKRLEDARRDGDRVYAVLRGWGLSTDGRGGMTAPSAQGQARALIRAYQSAGYPPASVDFIEGHGTGTAVGDRVELEGIAQAVNAFGGAADYSIGVTSFKSIVGHTKAAAGIGGFIKTVIALNRRIMPPTAGCEQPHGSFSESAKVLFPVLAGKIHAPETQLRAGVSAMGFGGINCHVTLESGDPPAPELQPSVAEEMLLASYRSSEIFPFAAADCPALLEAVQQTRRLATGLSSGELVDLAALCAAAVQTLPWRAVVLAASVKELLDKLETLENQLHAQPLPAGEIWRGEQIWLSHQAACARLGFLFPGQGSQQIGMAYALTKRFAWAKEFADNADTTAATLQGKLGAAEPTPNLSRLFLANLDADPANLLKPALLAELTQTQNAQPAICTASWLWLQQLSLLGVKPVVVGGHSLGELTALAAAGMYDGAALVRYAALRGIAMLASTGAGGSMAALACGSNQAAALLARLDGAYCVIANHNSPQQTVISGDSAAVERMLELAGESGVRAVKLPVSNAFHSRLVAAAAEQLRHSPHIEKTAQPAVCRLFSGSGGQEIGVEIDLKNHLAEQITSPVDFSRLLAAMSAECDMFIEVGPGRVLTGLAQSHAADAVRPCFPVESLPGKHADLNVVLAEAFVRGSAVHWRELYTGRLVRAFVPAAQRKFYVNPCERKLAEVESKQPFLLTTDSRPALDISTIVENIITAPPLSAAEPVNPRDRKTPAGSVRSLVLDLICERTGFAESSIADDARLLDDLHLDSIKIGSLIGDAALRLGVAGKIDAIALASANVQQLIAAYEAAVGSESLEPGLTEILQAKKTKPARWVRAFYQTKIAEALALEAEPDLNFAQNLLLIAPGGHSAFSAEFAETLGVPLYLDAPGADFAGLPARLMILLAGGAPCSANEAVRQLSLLHRLNQQHPLLWQRLQSLVFVQLQCAGKTIHGPEAWSFAASLSQERPELEVVVLGVDRQLSIDCITQSLATELCGAARYHAVEFDAAGQRWLRRMQTITPEQCLPRTLTWSSQDVLLVTGGGKGITAACALEFVRETGIKLAILGRSALPLPGEQSELAATLARVSALHIDYCYYAADVADSVALAGVAAAIRRDLGPITGVLHGAGSNTPRRATDVSGTQAEAEIATKLRGAENLLTLFAATPLKFFAVFTSIIGVTGMRNNAWYAYSNETVARLLDAYAQAHPSTATVAYAFGVWDEVGMGVKLGSVQHLEQMGIDAIAVADGVRQFLRWVNFAPPATEVIITASHSGLAAWQPVAMPNAPALTGRFLGSVLHSEPGVERLSRVFLDSLQDLYLQDHNYRGSLLFPTVMGLEAMAQNCFALLADADLEVIRIENIRLEHPIVVQPGRKLAIEIRVLAAERESTAAAVKFAASIHTEHTGWELAHFSADFIFGQRQCRDAGEQLPATRGMLGLVPSLDCYGEALFQGPLFQRISAIVELSRSSVSFITEARQQTLTLPEGFSAELVAPLVLGDAYYRDTLLQAAQLSLTPELCLPFRIAAIDLYAHAETSAFYRAQANIIRREGRKIFAEVLVVDANNQLIERISGYELQLMEQHSNMPSLEHLLNKPYHAQQPLFQHKCDLAAGAFGCFAPAVLLRRIPRLSDQAKQARHNLEAPVFRTALQLAGERYAIDPAAQSIGWLASGKPLVYTAAILSESQQADSALGISLSHAGDWVLCSTGLGVQGCDFDGAGQLQP